MKFRKRPVVIDAVQAQERQVIHTLEGDMVANPGDWIITGVKGEKYPCKPGIFEATYKLVESSELAEVGDEERERLINHFDNISEETFYSPDCPQCQQIRALLRQPRRTVSREWILSFRTGGMEEDGSISHTPYISIENVFRLLSELGYTIEEPKGEEEKA